MITPTITLRQNRAVSSLSNRDEYSLQCVCRCEGVYGEGVYWTEGHGESREEEWWEERWERMSGRGA